MNCRRFSHGSGRTACRPLLTFMASGRSDSYQAVSCHPGCSKAERQLFLLPAGRNRPNVTVELLRKAAVQRGIYASRSGSA